MLVLLGIVFSSLSFSAPNTCANLWDLPSPQAFTEELQLVLEAPTGTAIRTINLFSSDLRHNSAMITLVLLKPKVLFDVEISPEIYKEQIQLFNILLMHPHVRLFVGDAQIPQTTLLRPSDSQVKWLVRLGNSYFIAEGFYGREPASLQRYNQLLQKRLGATP